MPPEQVDAMVAAGPAPRRRTPEVAPVVKLLRGLAGRTSSNCKLNKTTSS